jgi:hypothetical protein
MNGDSYCSSKEAPLNGEGIDHRIIWFIDHTPLTTSQTDFMTLIYTNNRFGGSFG